MGVALRWKKLKSGKESAYLDISKDGQRHYEFLKIYIPARGPKRKELKAIAERIRSEREIELMTEDYDYQPQSRRKANFIAFFQNFVVNYHKAGVRKFRYALKKFILYIESEHIPFSKLTPKLCQGFKEFLLDKNRSGLSGETPADYFKRFRTVLNQAVSDGYLSSNPAKNIRIKVDQGQLKKKVLSVEELTMLYRTHCGNPDVKKAFLFACYTGIGMAEIRELKWGDINDENQLTLNREKNDNPIKNFVPAFALNLLGEKKELDSNIFQLPSDTAIRKDIFNWVKRAGIDKKITFYCARHTFSILLLTYSNPNPKVLADLLGHSSLRYIHKYLNHTDELKKAAVEGLPSLSKD